MRTHVVVFDGWEFMKLCGWIWNFRFGCPTFKGEDELVHFQTLSQRSTQWEFNF